MAEGVSPQLLKVLTDVTGEVNLDSALRIVTQDAIDYRLEHLARQIHALEQKYGMSFEQFDQRFQAGEIPAQHSYAVEQDYLDWEGIDCRQEVTGGMGLAPLTLREMYRDLIDISAQSPIVTRIEILLLDKPIPKLRVHLDTVTFVEVFFNVATGKTSFTLIKERQRIFGVENTRRWHMHPFNSPESHHPCVEMAFEHFLRQVEQHKDKWFEAETNAR